MSATTKDPSSTITVIYTDLETDEGEKAVFGSVRRMVTRVETLNVAGLAENLTIFCRQLGEIFERVTTAIDLYELDSIELTLEVTANGAIRFVGSAGGEIKGGLKLVFTRNTTNHRLS